MTDDIGRLLSTFVVSDVASSSAAILEAVPELEAGLFDIKLLNVIDEKMARGSAKKVYMAGKRGNKSTSDVLTDIREELTKSEMMNDDIDNFLNGIG